MTPLHLKILLHYYVQPHLRYAYYDLPHASSVTTVDYTNHLVRDGLLEPIDEGFYITTDKGKFYIEALCSLPIPVEKKIWEIPK